jgi:MFS family permease
LAPDSTNPDTANYWPLFLVTAGIMMIGMIALMVTIDEPKLVKKMRVDSAAMGIDPEEAVETKDKTKKKEKTRLPRELRPSMLLILSSIVLWFMGYNAVTTAFSRYVTRESFGMTAKQGSFILMVAVITATIAFVPIGFISSKIGRKKSIMGGIVLLVTVFATATLYTGFSPLMYISFALAGIAWAAINVNSLPMVLELSKGADVGRFTGFYYTASMAAQIATPIISGALLQYVGYWTLFPYGALFIGLAFFTMLFVRHGDSKPIPPKSKLEALDAGD